MVIQGPPGDPDPVYDVVRAGIVEALLCKQLLSHIQYLIFSFFCWFYDSHLSSDPYAKSLPTGCRYTYDNTFFLFCQILFLTALTMRIATL